MRDAQREHCEHYPQSGSASFGKDDVDLHDKDEGAPLIEVMALMSDAAHTDHFDQLTKHLDH